MNNDAPRATGVLDADSTLHFRRVLPLSREEAWAAITDSDRTARWFGAWRAEQIPGPIVVTMTAEEGSPDAPGEITEVEPLDHYVMVSDVGGDQWVLTVGIEASDGEGDRTTVTLSHPVSDPEQAAMIGPGWDFYLDRLVAAETGGDVDAISFEPDYVPALCEYYRGLYA